MVRFIQEQESCSWTFCYGKITWKDEWLAEAYMETDYASLESKDFQKVLNDYLSYLIKEGYVNGN